MASLWIRTGWPSSNLSPNGRPNRWQKARSTREAKAEGFWSAAVAKPLGFKFKAGPLKVTIEAHPPARWTHGDDDNLISSAKAFLDGIASSFGVDDDCFVLQPVRWSDKSPSGYLVFEVSGDMA